MSTLPEVLLSDERREQLVTDSVHLIDSEVAKRRGVTGFALKGGYKVIKSLKAQDGQRMLPKAVNDLLPEFAEAVETFHATYRSSRNPGDTFARYAQGKERAIANALLGITDGKAQHAKNQVLKKVYYKLRPRAESNICESMPAISALIDQHAPQD